MKGNIHILNGQEMYNFFEITHFIEQELIIPFNEAMCFGDTCSDIFSKEFIDLRSKAHKVTTKQYTEITLEPLERLFNGSFSRIILWFDTDMFCQMNLLTILAWLDQKNFPGQVKLLLISDHYKMINKFDLEVEGYYSLYKRVLINKEAPEHIEPAPLKKGVDLYLNYLHKDGALMKFIKKHQHLQEKELVYLLLVHFKEYGLGDVQYLEMIRSYRKGHS